MDKQTHRSFVTHIVPCFDSFSGSYLSSKSLEFVADVVLFQLWTHCHFRGQTGTVGTHQLWADFGAIHDGKKLVKCRAKKASSLLFSKFCSRQHPLHNFQKTFPVDKHQCARICFLDLLPKREFARSRPAKYQDSEAGTLFVCRHTLSARSQLRNIAKGFQEFGGPSSSLRKLMGEGRRTYRKKSGCHYGTK